MYRAAGSFQQNFFTALIVGMLLITCTLCSFANGLQRCCRKSPVCGRHRMLDYPTTALGLHGKPAMCGVHRTAIHMASCMHRISLWIIPAVLSHNLPIGTVTPCTPHFTHNLLWVQLHPQHPGTQRQ